MTDKTKGSRCSLKQQMKRNLELGAGRRLAGAGGSSAVCPGTDVENRRNPPEEKPNRRSQSVGSRIPIKTWKQKEQLPSASSSHFADSTQDEVSVCVSVIQLTVWTSSGATSDHVTASFISHLSILASQRYKGSTPPSFIYTETCSTICSQLTCSSWPSS